jgi:hypothetical protein
MSIKYVGCKDGAPLYIRKNAFLIIKNNNTGNIAFFNKSLLRSSNFANHYTISELVTAVCKSSASYTVTLASYDGTDGDADVKRFRAQQFDSVDDSITKGRADQFHPFIQCYTSDGSTIACFTKTINLEEVRDTLNGVDKSDTLNSVEKNYKKAPKILIALDVFSAALFGAVGISAIITPLGLPAVIVMGVSLTVIVGALGLHGVNKHLPSANLHIWQQKAASLFSLLLKGSAAMVAVVIFLNFLKILSCSPMLLVGMLFAVVVGMLITAAIDRKTFASSATI